MGGASYDLPIRINQSGVKILGGAVQGNHIHLAFEGQGWVRKTITW